jgi:hypothetical protein
LLFMLPQGRIIPFATFELAVLERFLMLGHFFLLWNSQELKL